MLLAPGRRRVLTSRATEAPDPAIVRLHDPASLIAGVSARLIAVSDSRNIAEHPDLPGIARRLRVAYAAANADTVSAHIANRMDPRCRSYAALLPALVILADTAGPDSRSDAVSR